nr:GtrA family protein [Neobacillus sp. Marseille-Q6967]
MQVSKKLLLKFISYSIVGFICTLIYFLAVFILVELFNKEPVFASAIAFMIMTVFSFFLNIRYTFGGDVSSKNFIRFFIVAGIGFILNFTIMHTMVNVLSFHYSIGELTTILIIPLVNFTLNNYWTFKSNTG